MILHSYSLIILSIFFVLGSSDPRCPFSSCASTYNTHAHDCTITCRQSQFPNLTDPIPSNRIWSITFSNLESLPNFAFNGLIINSLTINGQNLKFVDKMAFENITSLNRLMLNSISNISLFLDGPLDSLKNKLQQISISRSQLDMNTITKLVDNFDGFSRLNSFTVTGNNLTNFNYNFSSIPNLNSLTLSSNGIQSINIISNSIQTMDLNNNQLKTFNQNFTESMPKIVNLNLRWNSIDFFQIQSSSLKTLDLSSNRISEIIPEAFGQLPNLIKSINQTMTQGLTNLEFLYLSSNRISEISPEAFSQLPNLIRLELHQNLIKSINQTMTQGLTNLGFLDLSSNRISEISPETFCHLLKLRTLYLSNNNLSSVSLFCLEQLNHLRLNSVSFNGSINQTRLGNPINVQYLYLNNNNINEIDLTNVSRLNYLYLGSNNLSSFKSSTINSMSNVAYLDVSFNKIENIENIKNLGRLITLTLNNNLIKKISNTDFLNLTSLTRLNLNSNSIEELEFVSLGRLRDLFISSNKLTQIKKKSLENLANLETINLSNNQLERIHVNAFENNKIIRSIFLSNNLRIDTIPSLKELKRLQTIDLRNNNIKRIPNFAFERDISPANPIGTSISIDLTMNPIEDYSTKALCSQFSFSFGFSGITLRVDNINKMPKCMLTQLKSDMTSIVTSSIPNCDIAMMARNQSITISRLNNNCNQSMIVNDCSSNSKYNCPKGEDFIRHTTWITGDPHLFSYKRNYQLCEVGQDAICFHHENVLLLCTDEHIGAIDQIATVLVKVKFVYIEENGQQVTFEADNTKYPQTFSNGLTYIENARPGNREKAVELINLNNGAKVIYIEKSKTHIFISRWNRFYSITLRATHQTYSQSLGHLYEGCSLTFDNFGKNIRKKRNAGDEKCKELCSNIGQVDDENMPLEIVKQACMFDCINVNEDFVGMIRQSVALVNISHKSDEDNILSNIIIPTIEPPFDPVFPISSSAKKLAFTISVLKISLIHLIMSFKD